MLRVLSVVLLCGLSGCDLVASYFGGPATEARPRADAGDADLGDDAVAPSDAAPTDLDAAPPLPDLGPACPAKAAPLAASTQDCSCMVGSSVDCDGLEDVLEPQNKNCNPLLFEANLATNDPKMGWSFAGIGWTWGCNGLQQLDTRKLVSNAEQWNWAYATIAMPQSDTLIEVRFTLGPVNDSEEWSVGVLARLGSKKYPNGVPYQYINCSLRIDTKGRWNTVGDNMDPITNPDLKVEMIDTNGLPAWPRNNPRTLPANVGDTVRLLLWYRSTPYTQRQLMCAAIDEATGARRDAWYEIWSQGNDPSQPNVHDSYLPPGPGSIGLRTRNRQVTFDYIRVYGGNGI